MSASERLRALADYGDLNMPSDYIDRLDAVADALPLIADVVEAAEVVGQWPPENRYDYPPLAAALTALREHLEGGDE